MKQRAVSDINSSEAMIDEREHMAAYLLGELSEEAQLRFERDYFVNDIAYQQLLVVEDELAYDYLQGRLSPERRARFESTIGATERGRGNLEFGRHLLEALRASQTMAASSTRYIVAGIAAILLLGVLTGWLALRESGLSSQLAELRADNARSQARLEAELRASNQKPATAPLVASLLLTPGLSRSTGGPGTLKVSAQADFVRLELVPPPGAASGNYVAAIRDASEAELWSQSVTLSEQAWILKIPAKLLPAGAYQVAVRRLTAGEQAPDLATYSFRLIRK